MRHVCACARACARVSKRRKGRSDKAMQGGVGPGMARQGEEIGRKRKEEQKMEARMERCCLGCGRWRGRAVEREGRR